MKMFKSGGSGRGHTSTFIAFLKDDTGASALEYTVFVAFFGLAVFAALEILGVSLSNFFTGSAAHMEAKKPS